LLPVTDNGELSVSGERPVIVISTEEHLVNAEAAAALASDPEIYQRGGMLVRIINDKANDNGIRWSAGPRIDLLPREILRERLAKAAAWKKVSVGRSGQLREQADHPPQWCIGAVHARGEYPGIRHLHAVVQHPVLRPDGTVVCTSGYDAQSGLYLHLNESIAVPNHPTRQEVQEACSNLLDIVSDFPFESPAHKAGWLAGLLTPLARFAFEGPAPLFLVDANVRGAGKGLLLQTLGLIVNGREPTIATYTKDEDELRKRITALVIAGEVMAVFDNLEGRFGNGTLDAALTASSWQDRLLGVNRIVSAPMLITWYATGNNVHLGADTARRICPIRMESDKERPEERQEFRYPDLLTHVRTNRGRLLKAALTILRGYCAADKPDMKLPAWGTYNGWSGLVRSAVVWAGLPDPASSRANLMEHADTTAQGMQGLLTSLQHLDPERRGLTAAELITWAKVEPPTEVTSELRSAIEELVGKLDSTALGCKLRDFRRRIVGGLFLDSAGKKRKAQRWTAFPESQFRVGRDDDDRVQGEGGEDGEGVSLHDSSAANSDVWLDKDMRREEWENDIVPF